MNERVVVFGPEGSLVGIITEPDTVRRPSLPALLLLNAGMQPRVGPNRLHVKIARRLAQRGVVSLRFDFSGIGDSLRPRHGRPFCESAVIETREAMDFLAAEVQPTSFVLAGICSGADAAQRAAELEPRVSGTILIDGYTYPTARYYVHRYALGALAWRRWRNLLSRDHHVWRSLFRRKSSDEAEADVGFFELPPREGAEASFRRLLDRGVNLCMIHTVEGGYYYAGQFFDSFPSLRGRERISVHFIPEADHVFTALWSQDRLIDRIDEWFETADWSAAPVRGPTVELPRPAERRAARE